MAKPKKRLYIINRDFQFRYSFAAVLVGIVSTIMTVGVILFPLYHFEILRIAAFLPLPILSVMLVAAFLNIMIIAFFGVIITHRIAGPMYSLVRSFRRIEMGRWAGHLRIRENDDLRYLVRNFNQLVDSLVRSTRKDIELLDELAQNLGNKTSEVEGTLEKLRNRLEHRIRTD